MLTVPGNIIPGENSRFGGLLPPTVSGVSIPTSGTVSNQLTVSYTLGGGPATVVTRAWYRGATLIASSTTSDNYTPVAADAGQNIFCRVIPVNAAGSASADSNNSAILLTILDLYPGASGAWFLTIQRGAYLNNPLVRVRRSSDNLEVDVYADSNYAFSLNSNINSRTSGTTLRSWIDSDNGFAVIQYDQSGSGNNNSQTTPLLQPQIINSGSVILRNSNAVLLYNSKYTEVSGITSYSQISLFSVGNSSSGNNTNVISSQDKLYFGAFSGTNWGFLGRNIYTGVVVTSPSINGYTTAVNTVAANTSYINYCAWLGLNTDIRNRRNGVDYPNVAISGGTLRSGSILTGTIFDGGEFFGAIVYLTNQYSNRIAIEQTLNAIYNVY